MSDLTSNQKPSNQKLCADCAGLDIDMPNESQERADRLDANVSLFALDKYASDTRPADIEFREVHELCKEIERLTHENARLQSIVTLRERATDEPAAPLDLRRYFKVSPVAVQGEPDACRLDFHVGVQTIPIGPEYCETAEHAEWWINVICKALQNVISAASRPAEPPTDALTLEQLTAAIAYMGCDTDREYTPEAFARDLFAAARQSSTKGESHG